MTPLEISTSRVQDLLEQAATQLPGDSPHGLDCTSMWIQAGMFVTAVEPEPPAMPADPAECVWMASRETESWDFEQLGPMAVEFAATLALLGLSMRQATATP